jgi:hypothetical protein
MSTAKHAPPHVPPSLPHQHQASTSYLPFMHSCLFLLRSIDDRCPLSSSDGSQRADTLRAIRINEKKQLRVPVAAVSQAFQSAQALPMSLTRRHFWIVWLFLRMGLPFTKLQGHRSLASKHHFTKEYINMLYAVRRILSSIYNHPIISICHSHAQSRNCLLRTTTCPDASER